MLALLAIAAYWPVSHIPKSPATASVIVDSLIRYVRIQCAGSPYSMAMNPRPGPDEDLIDWLQLARCDGVGPITFGTLLGRYRVVAAALRAG